MGSRTGWLGRVSRPSVRAVSHDGTTNDDELASIPVIGDERPTAKERIEMLRAYVEEQRSVGRQAMGASVAGSVQWLWGRVLVEEMTSVLAVMDGTGSQHDSLDNPRTDKKEVNPMSTQPYDGSGGGGTGG